MGSVGQAELKLRERIRQQEVVADLGQRALDTDDIDQFMHDVCVAVAETLDNDYCKVLELMPGGDHVLLREGVGWREGLVGDALVPTDLDSQAGYTLLSEEPVVVDDLRTEDRFSGPELLTSHDVVSGISVIIGSVEDPWGVLGTHTTEPREFTVHDANFVQSIANILASSIENESTRTELERALDLLEKTERIADVGGWEIDVETKEVFWTEHIFELLEWPDDEEPPLEEALDVYLEADRPIIEGAIEAALETGDPFDVEARIRMDSGEVRWLRLQGVPEIDDDDIVSCRGVAQDVTERKKREQRLEEVIDRLEASNERLEQFAYAASHDLQEPLRMVSSYLQLLESRHTDVLDEEAEEFLAYAVEGADRMRAMVDDLLAYSRIEQADGTYETVDCAELLVRVRADLQMQIEETDAEIQVASLPTVMADGEQLEQLFLNLVSNAIKYRGDEPPAIEITARKRGDCWEFSVSDNGIGIAPDKTDRIFEVFKRLHHEDEYPGTGIGLSLCQEIVENHGGEIWVESEPGDGSTFFFTLPRRR